MLLKINSITKSFAEKTVLEDISFSVKSGKALGLLGRNGAGKTTTIRIILDVFPADKGEITIDGKPLRKQKLNIGYLPEERGLYPKKIIIDQLVYLGELKGIKASTAKATARKLLARLEMEEYANRKLETLSKGNQQKIQLAATLICNPDIIILDEPFSGLDPVNAALLKDIVKELISQGKIVMFSSHQMNYVEEFCDDIVILNKGKIVLDGNIREIKKGSDRSTIVVSGERLHMETITQFLHTKLQDTVESFKTRDEQLFIKLRNAEKKAELIKAFSQAELSFDSFKIFEPSLNEIFIKYTEDAV